MRKILIFLIDLYQKTISPDHGWFSKGKNQVCIFQPTCSEYTKQAIKKYGSLKGSYLGFLRILRCNPWNKGGYDPVPKDSGHKSKNRVLMGVK